MIIFNNFLGKLSIFRHDFNWVCSLCEIARLPLANFTQTFQEILSLLLLLNTALNALIAIDSKLRPLHLILIRLLLVFNWRLV